MKIYITSGAQAGPVNGRLAIAELKLAAQSLNHELAATASDADVIVKVGEGLAVDSSIVGKKVYVVADLDGLFADAKSVLNQSDSKAEIYSESASSTTEVVSNDNQTKRIVAVTACPTGVAHTYMAAEAIEEEAKKRGWWCKVETRGSVGAGNELTPEEVASADVVIIACDIEVDLSKFDGKLMYRTKTGPALKKTAEEFDKAFKMATVYHAQANAQAADSGQKRGPYQHLLTGVSFMLPMVVAAGLITALSFAFGHSELLADGTRQMIDQPQLSQIGSLAFSMMVPLLSAYISYSVADRPGLVPGFVGGLIADTMKAGFLGGIVSGFFAGYLTYALVKHLKLPQTLEALKPILILPLVSTLIVGLGMQFVIGHPIELIMSYLANWLTTMQTANAIIVGALLGGMMCTDMGGPINKCAYAFAVGLIASHVYEPMAAVMAGGMVPPLAMGIATVIARRKFAKAEQQSGKAAFVLGACFITEGAIPFAAADPARVLPSCMIGGAITGGLALSVHTNLMVPHGGIFAMMIPQVITNAFTSPWMAVLIYAGCIIIGAIISGVIYACLRKKDAATDSKNTIKLW